MKWQAIVIGLSVMSLVSSTIAGAPGDVAVSGPGLADEPGAQHHCGGKTGPLEGLVCLLGDVVPGWGGGG